MIMKNFDRIQLIIKKF